MERMNWKKYGFEFLSIFIAVLSAFALNNWNDNRRDNNAESKILIEIANGLEKDIEDIRINKGGHEEGIKSCKFWRSVVTNEEVNLDTMIQYFFNLTRDYISIQNISGYESLKSKGLELLNNDSLRLAIISLYEYDYSILRKFEEEYYEMQFQQNYFEDFNNVLAPNFSYDEKGNMIGINTPLKISEDERNILLSYLWKIQVNRQFIIQSYNDVEHKVTQVRQMIKDELKE